MVLNNGKGGRKRGGGVSARKLREADRKIQTKTKQYIYSTSNPAKQGSTACLKTCDNK